MSLAVAQPPKQKGPEGKNRSFSNRKFHGGGMVIATSEVTFSIGELRPLYIFMMISCMTLHFGMQSLVLSTSARANRTDSYRAWPTVSDMGEHMDIRTVDMTQLTKNKSSQTYVVLNNLRAALREPP